MTKRSTPAGPAAKRRHVRYSQALAKEIAARIAEGSNFHQLSLEEEMPCATSLYNWVRDHLEFAALVARAEEMRADWCAHRALQVAENTAEGVSGDRLRVATLMKQAAIDNPDRYGDGKGRKDADRAPPKQRVILEVRDFRPVILDDGRIITREFMADGSHVDHD